MSIVFFLKRNLNKIPIGIGLGQIISHIPYRYRPGLIKSYSAAQKDLKNFEAFSNEQQKQFIFEKVKKLVDFAYENITFYKEYYKQRSFHPRLLSSFDDLQKIPIINKSLLQQYTLEQRSKISSGLAKSNTGGSTGKPLTFYTSKYAIGNEWAHIHKMWNILGFKPSHLKLVFAGRSSVKDYVEYDFIRHTVTADLYADFYNIQKKLLKILRRHPIHYLHGYPSALYEFAIFCDNHAPVLKDKLRQMLKGAFLSSEYPYSKYRNKIEEVFGIKTQSFYGHTERCIMAYEKENQFEFEVMQSYGYAEVVNDSLVGTSYYSFGTPLIRYDTEDKVEAFFYDKDILVNFKIKEGRKADFILDKNNKMIPLTGLIFGRHHQLFDYCQYIQVYQERPGYCLILFNTDQNISVERAKTLFDSSNVEMEFEFRKIDKPYKTAAGKVPIKINNL